MGDKSSFGPLFDSSWDRDLRADLDISGVETVTAILLVFYEGAKEHPKNSVELIIHAVNF